MSRLTRSARLGAAACALVAGLIAPAAHAAPQLPAPPHGNGLAFGGSTYSHTHPTHGHVDAVVFGDSVPANSNPLGVAAGHVNNEQVRNGLRDVGGATPYNRLGCSSDGHFIDAYSKASGLSTGNYTCSGASYGTGGIKINQAVDVATQHGDLNGSTKEVAILAGANDTYPRIGITPDSQTPNQIRDDLKRNMVNTINHIHRVAPNARVKIIGYPQVTDKFGMACTIDAIPNVQGGHVPGVGIYENIVQWAGATAAREAHAQFVDLKPQSQGHGTCDPDRWYSGVVDSFPPAPYKLLLHLNDNGMQQVGTLAGRA